jgi:hypothetical protein
MRAASEIPFEEQPRLSSQEALPKALLLCCLLQLPHAVKLVINSIDLSNGTKFRAELDGFGIVRDGTIQLSFVLLRMAAIKLSNIVRYEYYGFGVVGDGTVQVPLGLLCGATSKIIFCG